MKRGCKEEGKREWGRERAESASRRVDCRPSVFVIRNLIIFQLTSATTCTGSRDVRSSVLYPTTWNARWFVASPVLYPVRHLCSPIAYTLASPSSFDHRYLDNFTNTNFQIPFFYLFSSFSFLHFINSNSNRTIKHFIKRKKLIIFATLKKKKKNSTRIIFIAIFSFFIYGLQNFFFFLLSLSLSRITLHSRNVWSSYIRPINIDRIERVYNAYEKVKRFRNSLWRNLDAPAVFVDGSYVNIISPWLSFFHRLQCMVPRRIGTRVWKQSEEIAVVERNLLSHENSYRWKRSIRLVLCD